MSRFAAKTLLVLCVGTGIAAGQDRAEKVRRDKRQLAENSTWVYNDFKLGLAEAKRSLKPLFVVIRCIPCEACSKFDKQLLDEDNEVRDLLDQFVCVRIVQANGLDLSLFQFDYDQSFHALFLNADKTIYGRFGTRSARPEEDDMTMAGLRKTMLAALDLHSRYPSNKKELAGKQGHAAAVKVPEELTDLKEKYGSKLDYEGNVVKSCLHCHQIRDSERIALRQKNEPFPAQVLFPYPLPDVLGLRMDQNEPGRIQDVAIKSAAEQAGLQRGDSLKSLGGQPLISTADLQWVLHHAPARGALAAVVERGKRQLELSIALESGWRETGDISFRPTTWDLRRMATGGLVLEDLSDDDRQKRGLEISSLALRVKYVGEYGDHAAGKRAGFQKDDVIVTLESGADRLTEGQFIAAALAHRRGETLSVKVLRGGETLEFKLPLQ